MKELKECLACGNKNLNVYIDMGQMPLVNNLKESPHELEHIFPLLVNECPLCTHKQLSVSVDRELMFNEYLYKTGTSQKHKEFISEFVNSICNFNLGQSLVLDIGSNDGTLLSYFKIHGWEVIGIEPSEELALICIKKDIPIINDYFPRRMYKKYDCITAFNVFAHNDDPRSFLIEMSKLLKENGRIYILTTPSRLDNYYHEHISYFTPQSMMVLANKCGVEVVSFKTVSMHGKSYLFEIMNRKEQFLPREIKLSDPCVAYGASASETVLFNYYDIKPEYVVDDNPLKQGKFIPGINSPIVSSERLVQDIRDLTIIVAHHLFDEISAKIKNLRPLNKDKFVRLI